MSDWLIDSCLFSRAFVVVFIIHPTHHPTSWSIHLSINSTSMCVGVTCQSTDRKCELSLPNLPPSLCTTDPRFKQLKLNYCYCSKIRARVWLCVCLFVAFPLSPTSSILESRESIRLRSPCSTIILSPIVLSRSTTPRGLCLPVALPAVARPTGAPVSRPLRRCHVH